MSKAGKLYSVSRAYALKGFLLPHRIYEELASSKTIPEIVEKLRPTRYGGCIREEREIDSLKFEKIVRSCMIDDEYRLIREIDRPGALEQYFRRHLYRNLKHVLKGKALGREQDEIMRSMTLKAEEHLRVRDVVVRALAEATLESAVETLANTPIGRVAEESVRLYEREEDLLVFDIVLDGAFYRELLQGLDNTPRMEREPLRKAMAAEIDGYLILAITRSKSWELTAAETRRLTLEEGVEVPRSIVSQMLEAETPQSLLEPLRNTPYRKLIAAAPTQSFHELALHLEERFRSHVIEVSRKAFLQDIFKLSVIYGLIRLREEEIYNLTAIAFGVEQGLPPHRILESIRRIL